MVIIPSLFKDDDLSQDLNNNNNNDNIIINNNNKDSNGINNNQQQSDRFLGDSQSSLSRYHIIN